MGSFVLAHSTRLETMKLSTLILAFIIATTPGMPNAHASEDLDKVITYLLDYVRKADVIFIRNGKEHTPQASAKHMQ